MKPTDTEVKALHQIEETQGVISKMVEKIRTAGDYSEKWRCLDSIYAGLKKIDRLSDKLNWHYRTQQKGD